MTDPRDRTATTDGPTLPLPPNSKGLPFIGESLAFLREPDFSRRRHDRYGPVFRAKLFGMETVFLKGAEANRFVFGQDSETLGVQWPKSTKILLGPASLSTQHDPQHRQRRRLLSQAFQPRMLALYGQGMDDLTRNYGDRWLGLGTFAWYPELRNYTLDIACRLLVGLDGGSAMPLGHWFELWSQGLFSLPVNLPWTTFGRALKARRMLLAELGNLIAARRNAPQPDPATGAEAIAADALGVLLAAVDKAGNPLSDREIADQILTLLFAGHETLTSAIASFCLLTAQHPTVLERLRAEQDGFDPEAPLTMEDLRSMTYLDQVLQEVLRFLPPVGGGFRQALKDLAYGGYRIPKGSALLYQINRTHEDPSLYADPGTFDPDRWSGDRANPNQYLPFGGGVRECLGKEFARLEMRIFAARMVQRYVWEVVPDQDLSLVMVPTPRPRDGLRVRLGARSRDRVLV
ncbi:MAG: cytochrome P450 [Cyanophyceae cyanobacterium]